MTMSDECRSGVLVTVRAQRTGATAGQIEPEYLTKRQVAQRLNVSMRTVDNLMRSGVLPYHKLKRLVRFEPSDVNAHLRSHCRVCRQGPEGSTTEQGRRTVEKAESRN